MLSLKDIQFLSLQDSCFPVKEHQDVCPSPVAKIPKSYVPNMVTSSPKVSASEGVETKSNSDEENRPHIRASSIPRPRAVLSSPDNDAVIGSKAWTEAARRPSALKNHNSVQNRHARAHSKVITRHGIDESLIKARQSKDEFVDTSKNGIKEGKGSAPAVSKRRNVTATKPSFVRI